MQRLHLRSTAEGVDHDELMRWCVERGWAGVGWGLWDRSLDRCAWEQYLARATGDVGSVRRLHDLRDGTLIWTRERSGTYWLGEVTGPWEYHDDDDAQRLDLFNVRPATWWRVGTEEAVPGRVVNAFRPARTLQRIGDKAAREYSNRLYGQYRGASETIESVDPRLVVKSLIGAADLEDLVAVYLQDHYDFLLVSRNRSTPGYEYDLRHREDGHRAVCTVKSGDTHVNLDLLPSASVAVSFAYAVSGQYDGAGPESLTRITTDELADFLMNRRAVLPGRVAAWLNRS